MSEVRDGYLYTKEHEWLKLEDDGSVTVGITDQAQEALGELVFVEVPEAGAEPSSSSFSHSCSFV